MKSYVLINRRTGDLFEGYRVSLFDKFDVAGDPYTDTPSKFRVSLVKLVHDGWCVFHPSPKWGGFWIWFNLKSSKMFEVLGEL